MFETLDLLPADPILGLNQQFVEDTNPDKINLSVGIYQNSQGQTPVFSAVKQAELTIIQEQQSKAYIAQVGDADFVQGISKLLLGESLFDKVTERFTSIMTPGGCGALRMGAELLVHANQQATIWVSSPTWGNHYPLLQSAGLKIESYDYYDPSINAVNFNAMLESLNKIPAGDVVLLHGCCHNPTGADLNNQQWDEVIALLSERKLTPFFDVAYLGLGIDLDNDAYGVRQAVAQLPEVLIANSCSKNFGLYRERVGAIMVLSADAQSCEAARSHVLSAARTSYSMSPYHGGGIVGKILTDTELTKVWHQELEQMCANMNSLRKQFAESLNQAQSQCDFSFVANSRGMFCYLGIKKQQVLKLREQFAIYILDNTRINIAGLSEQNIPIISERVAQVLAD